MIKAVFNITMWSVKALMILGIIHWVAPDLSYQLGYLTSEVTVRWLG